MHSKRLYHKNRISDHDSESKKDIYIPLTSSSDFSAKNRVSSLTTLCVDKMMHQMPDQFERLLKIMDTRTGPGGVAPFQCEQNIFYKRQHMLRKIFKRLICKLHCSRCHNDGYVYGGAIRDGLNKENPHDFDMRLCSQTCAVQFIKILEQHYHVQIWRQHYIGCISFCVQHRKHPEVEIAFDITYKTEFTNTNFDLDINMLKIRLSKYINGKCYNKVRLSNLNAQSNKVDVEDVVHNIHRKQFIVLSQDGRAITCHFKVWQEIIVNLDGEVIDCHSFLIKSVIGENDQLPNPTQVDPARCNSNGIIVFPAKADCISRYSQRGRGLLNRIAKMKARGWTCINEFCMNPDCVLASNEVVQAYKKLVDDKREKARLIKESERKIKDEAKLKAQKKRLIKRHYYANNMGYIPGAMSAKTGNRVSYKTSTIARERQQSKKQLTKFRPTNNTKKFGSVKKDRYWD